MNESTSDQLFDRLASLSNADAAQAIRQMIGQAENAQLDFKQKKNPLSAALDADDQRHFAKAASGFANSAGGLLIWGVEAKRKGNDPEAPDVVTSLHPIQNVDAFASHLDSLVIGATRPVATVENRAIIEDPKTKEGFCLTRVAPGDSPPYRTNLSGFHLYYKRAGSSFYEMEPYDIRDVIFRFRYPKLDIEISPGPKSAYYGLLVVRLTNKGPVSLRAFKFVLALPEALVQRPEGFENPNRLDVCGVPYVAYSVKSLVGCAASPDPMVPAILEPVYPGESIELIGGSPIRPVLGGGRVSRKLEYKLSILETGSDVLCMKVYWKLYAEDMPAPLSGEHPIIGLTL